MVRKDGEAIRADFLLELWAEELPVSYIPPALKQLEDSLVAELDRRGLEHGASRAYATPNRLIVIVDSVASKTRKEIRKIYGPLKKALLDENGAFTQAALGFAKKHGVSPEKILQENERSFVTITAGGEKAASVLAETIPQVIAALNFPKAMTWEKSRFRFARPIRNIVALYGEEVVRCEIAGVTSSRAAYGFFIHSDKKIVIKNAASYVNTMRNNCVTVDPAERKKAILTQAEQALKHLGAAIVRDEALLEQVCFLVENPVPIAGSFNEEFLRLPEIALMSCLKDKQKFFPLTDPSGRLIARFLGFRNGMSVNQKEVCEGYERVVDARLRDVRFFFEKDTRAALEHKVAKLHSLVQAEKLGSVYEKTQRVGRLAGFIAGRLTFAPDELERLGRAALLAKADLVTEMVFEYPELQGVMGGIYARRDNEHPDVADAIAEQYLPVQPGGSLPRTKLGAVLAIADKIDSIASSFALGYVPRGSGDPYGLRRMALGIAAIILDRRLELSLDELLTEAFAGLPKELFEKNRAALDNALGFIKQRMAVFFETGGFAYDLVAAVFAGNWYNLIDTRARLEALAAARANAEFEPFILLFRRAAHILRQARADSAEAAGAVQDGLFSEEAEKKLWDSCTALDRDFGALVESRKYQELFFTVVHFKAALTDFFDRVLVMDPDGRIKNNRLNMLAYFLRYFAALADFSKIVLTGEQTTRR